MAQEVDTSSPRGLRRCDHELVDAFVDAAILAIGRGGADAVSTEGLCRAAAPYVAEFVGTFLLAFTAGCCIVAGDATWNATAIASVLVALVYSFGPVSGGHLNPTVTLACFLVRATPWRKALGYVLSQCVAGLLAGLMCQEVFQQASVGPVAAHSRLEVGLCEVVYTAMLCFVVLNVTVPAHNNPPEDMNNFFGLAIGFVVVAGGYAAGPMTGALLNPALSLGLGIADGGQSDAKYWWRLDYIAFQLAGSIVAVVLYHLIRGEERVDSGGTLELRILAAYNLKNRDSGIAGDVSDPYVTARVGVEQRKTPTTWNKVNPVWTEGSSFTFTLEPSKTLLELEVMNQNQMRNDVSLGTLNVHLQEMPPGEWQRRREGLVLGGAGELEFDARVLAGSGAPRSLPARVLSEFIGTFLLVLTVGLNLLSGSTATAWSAAAALMSAICALGDVSGAHFNPAVTLGVVLSGRGKCAAAPDGAAYAAAQLLAGLLAGLLCTAAHGAEPSKPAELVPGWIATWLVEFAFTLMLVFVVLSVATVEPPASDTRQAFFPALAIGSCVTAGGLAAGALSGGALNPAVSLGVATMSHAHPQHAVPWLACCLLGLSQMAGGAFATLLFGLTHEREYRAKAC